MTLSRIWSVGTLTQKILSMDTLRPNEGLMFVVGTKRKPTRKHSTVFCHNCLGLFLSKPPLMSDLTIWLVTVVIGSHECSFLIFLESLGREESIEEALATAEHACIGTHLCRSRNESHNRINAFTEPLMRQ